MKQNIVLALRNLLKQKTNFIINILGLTIAISSLMIILLWIKDELSYDRFHVNAKNIYRIVSGNPADKEAWAGTPSPLGPFLKENFPDISSYTRFELISGIFKSGNDNLFYENKIAIADTSFFRIFSFPLISGDVNSAVKKKNFILLSESSAEKYFGTNNPIGKTLIFNDKDNYEVTGIYKDIPANSHIRFDALILFENIYNNNSWGQWNYFTYVLAKPSADMGSFKDKALKWVEKNRPDLSDNFKDLYYQPLLQVHFQFNRKNIEPTIEKYNIHAAIFIAILILIIACINFANLSIIQSFERTKEIALRKIMGESPGHLKVLLIAEAIFISIISLFLSVIIVENISPLFNKLFESHLEIKIFNGSFIFFSLSLAIITGILSGIYPAFIMSSFKPLQLFANFNKIKGKASMRTLLVIIQFTISIVLMISLFTINRQLNFIRSKKLGMNTENILNIRLQSPSISKQSKELKGELLKTPGVISASVNRYIPSKHNEHWGLNFNLKENEDDKNEGLWIIIADKDFIKTMQLEVIEGDELINNFSSTTEVPFILNESAAKLIKDGNVTGRQFEFFETNKGRIIGKVRDFHFRSLHHKIEPAAIILADMGNQISVRVKSNQLHSIIKDFEKTWKHFSPDLAFDYYFMKDDIEKLYKSEIKTNRLLATAGVLSILLCCLGIFGIVAYSAKKRAKEIGIRKVNGAHSSQIVAMLSKDYTWWIIISFIIACPVSYFLMNKWLQNYEYKVSLTWWLFALSGIIAFSIAIITVYWQSLRIANQDPLEALKYE